MSLLPKQLVGDETSLPLLPTPPQHRLMKLLLRLTLPDHVPCSSGLSAQGCNPQQWQGVSRPEFRWQNMLIL